MLWQIVGTQLQILGAIHVSHRVLDFHPKMVDAMQSATVLVFEGNLDHPPDTPLRFYGDSNLSAHIPGDLFRETKELWTELGLDDDELERARPWWAGFRVQMTGYHQRGYVGTNGVDRVILDFGNRNRRKTFFLESPNDELAPFAEASAHEQEIFLANCVREVEPNVQRLRAMIEAWQAFKPERVRAAVEETMLLTPVMLGAGLEGRNRKWLPNLLRFARSGKPTLAVLGTLHLVGKGSVPELLANSGFECIRILE